MKKTTLTDYLWGGLFMLVLGALLAFIYVMKTGGF